MPVYKDKNGTWYSKFRYKDWTGKTKDKTKRGFSTKRDAVQWENDFKAKESGDIDMTMGNFIEIYKKERFPRLKESTKAMKENIIDTKILPYFSKLSLNEIGASDIVKWQNELLRYIDPETGNHYTKSYLKTIHNQINAIFNYAVRYYKLKQNPASIAGNVGSEADIKVHYWTLEQYNKFSEEMMKEPIAYYAFQALYWLGIREGELLALTSDDIDFKEKTVSINKTYMVIKGKRIITTPKTIKSNRLVKMPDFLAEELKEYISRIPNLKNKDRIFEPVSKSFLYRHIKNGAKKAGIPLIRVHDLRHSHASLLINMGYSAVAIAERLGHESITITYHYAHMFPNVQNNMVDMLNKIHNEEIDYVGKES